MCKPRTALPPPSRQLAPCQAHPSHHPDPSLSQWRKNDPVALAWRDIVKGKLLKDSLIGTGVLVGLVGLGVAAVSIFKHRRRGAATA